MVLTVTMTHHFIYMHIEIRIMYAIVKYVLQSS